MTKNGMHKRGHTECWGGAGCIVVAFRLANCPGLALDSRDSAESGVEDGLKGRRRSNWIIPKPDAAVGTALLCFLPLLVRKKAGSEKVGVSASLPIAMLYVACAVICHSGYRVEIDTCTQCWDRRNQQNTSTSSITMLYPNVSEVVRDCETVARAIVIGHGR